MRKNKTFIIVTGCIILLSGFRFQNFNFDDKSFYIKKMAGDKIVTGLLYADAEKLYGKCILRFKKDTLFYLADTLLIEKTEEQKKTTSSANVSLKVLEVGKQPIQLYGIVKDIINEATGGQINAINAMNIIKQKKPIVENISQEKAEEYKGRLEGKTEEEKAKKGVVIEIVK